MYKTFLIIALGLAGFSSAAFAEVVAVPAPETEASTPAASRLPAKGESMAVVLKLFGQPTLKHKPVGGSSRHQPRITRWDYESFSVFFERGTVIDAVVKGRPPEVHHTEELKPAP